MITRELIPQLLRADSDVLMLTFSVFRLKAAARAALKESGNEVEIWLRHLSALRVGRLHSRM